MEISKYLSSHCSSWLTDYVAWHVFQFYLMKDHGTRIIIYNLWEDDQGQLELDFDTDQHVYYIYILLFFLPHTNFVSIFKLILNQYFVSIFKFNT